MKDEAVGVVDCDFWRPPVQESLSTHKASMFGPRQRERRKTPKNYGQTAERKTRRVGGGKDRTDNLPAVRPRMSAPPKVKGKDTQVI